MHHLLTIQYRKYVDGKAKRIREAFLVEAVSLVEIDTQIADIFKLRLKDPKWHNLRKLETLTKLIFFSGTTRPPGEPEPLVANPFFEVKAVFFGDKIHYIVPAKDADEALQRVLDYDRSLEAKYVNLVKVTKILGVWDPSSELWKGDFYNRNEMLYEQGQGNYDRNQTEIEGTQVDNKTEPGRDASAASNQFPTSKGRKKKQKDNVLEPSA